VRSHSGVGRLRPPAWREDATKKLFLARVRSRSTRDHPSIW
jgi:hypothetical protein